MGIRGKLILPFVFGYIVVVALIQFVWQPIYIAEELESYKETQHIALTSLEPELIRNLLSNDLATLYAHMEQHLELHGHHWISLTITDRSGNQIYPLIPVETGDLEDPLKINHQLKHLDEYLGELSLIADPTQTIKDELEHIHTLEEIILSVFALVFVFSFIWQNFLINKPLMSLKDSAGNLADGDFDTQIIIKSKDEIGNLSHSFETMRQQLKHQHIELEQAAALAQNSELKQRAVINTMSDAVITSDTNGFIESFNPAAERIFGYDAAEVLGQNINILMPTSEKSFHQNYVQNYLDSGSSYLMGEIRELKGQHKNGKILDIEISLSEINTEGLHLFSAIMRDISDRKIAEEQLRLAAIAFDTHEGITIVDKDANIIKVNPAFTQITGYTEDEVIGKNPRILASGKHDRQFYENLWNTLLEKGSWAGEIWNKRKNGEIYPEWLAVTAARNANNEITHYVANFLDISEQKTQQLLLREKAIELEKAKDAAELASQAKSSFLANMSHEIRTPMNGVLGMTQLLADTKLNAEQQEYVDVIESSGHMLLGIINDILDFSKIEAEKMALEQLSFNLRQTGAEIIKMMSVKASEKNIKLLFNYSDNCPSHVVGDAGRIRQILTNLIGNAIKFTHDGHVLLDITCISQDHNMAELLIKIEDTGIGISDEAKSRLFNAFSQADESTTRKFGGTGLGLAISKKLVELMNGKISVESTPGNGSVFWFTITLPIIRNKTSLARVNLTNKRILVIDDNEINRQLLTEQLEHFGMQVTVSPSARSGLEMLHQSYDAGQPFDMAILDFMMPEMDGQSLGNIIKNEPKLKALPLILLTSAAQRGDSQVFKNIGFAAYLTKPVHRNVLRQALECVAALDPDEADHELITQYNIPASDINTTNVSRFVGKILLVEDNIPNQMVASGMLKKLGLEVDIANHGKEAVQMFSDNAYDLILMDCRMPVMDGFEATQIIRSMETDQQVPVIALTANVQIGDQQKCRESGMNDFLSKPFSRNELITLLGHWLEQPLESIFINNQPAEQADREHSITVDKNILDMLKTTMGVYFEPLIHEFILDTDSRIKTMQQCLTEDRIDQLSFIAHSLKSSSGTLGAIHMSSLCNQLEISTEENDNDTIPELLEKLEQSYLQVKQYFAGISSPSPTKNPDKSVN